RVLGDGGGDQGFHRLGEGAFDLGEGVAEEEPVDDLGQVAAATVGPADAGDRDQETEQHEEVAEPPGGAPGGAAGHADLALSEEEHTDGHGAGGGEERETEDLAVAPGGDEEEETGGDRHRVAEVLAVDREAAGRG